MQTSDEQRIRAEILGAVSRRSHGIGPAAGAPLAGPRRYSYVLGVTIVAVAALVVGLIVAHMSRGREQVIPQALSGPTEAPPVRPRSRPARRTGENIALHRSPVDDAHGHQEREAALALRALEQTRVEVRGTAQMVRDVCETAERQIRADAENPAKSSGSTTAVPAESGQKELQEVETRIRLEKMCSQKMQAVRQADRVIAKLREDRVWEQDESQQSLWDTLRAVQGDMRALRTEVEAARGNLPTF